MAEIRSFLIARHLRADPSMHVLAYRGGKRWRQGRGLSLWFMPLSVSLAEVPVDDRELSILFHGRTGDYQDVTVQGVLTYRIENPILAAERIDFTIDSRSGAWARQPLEKLSLVVSQLGQQLAWSYIARAPIKEVLGEGHARIRERLEAGFGDDAGLGEIGLRVVSVRISAVQPTPDLEKALEAPMRERIQQEADEAAFSRRALAVEKERAIAENELQNRIELARREAHLIEEQGKNARSEATEEAEARRIQTEYEEARRQMEAAAEADRMRIAVAADAERMRVVADAEAGRTRIVAEAEAERIRLEGEARAEQHRLLEGARVESEAARIEIYRDLAPAVLMGLAARELAGKLERIDHLNLSPEALGPMLTRLMGAGTRRLEE
jgi:regulator of protease activity HflC (stomatin/prohibitin superfamily)